MNYHEFMNCIKQHKYEVFHACLILDALATINQLHMLRWFQIMRSIVILTPARYYLTVSPVNIVVFIYAISLITFKRGVYIFVP